MAPRQYKKCQKAFPRVIRNPKRAHAHPTARSALHQYPTIHQRLTPEETTPVKKPITKKKDIFIAIYYLKNKIYTDQTGKFPHTSSRGKKYQMIIHEIDGSSTWVEVMKNRREGKIIEA